MLADMVQGGNVSFEYEHEELGLLQIEAQVSDFYEAVRYDRYGNPGWPAEGGEVEELTIYRDGEEIPEGDLPAELVRTLESYAQDRIFQ